MSKFSRHHDCRKNPCFNTTHKKGCELNNLIRKFRLEHECPCYQCIVKTMCKDLCKTYTLYIDPILFLEYGSWLFEFPQEKKYGADNRVTPDFLSFLLERVSHYKPHDKAFVELDTIEYNPHHIEHATAQIIHSC